MKTSHTFIATKDIVCYKATDKNMQCRSTQYVLNQTVSVTCPLILCISGLHASFSLFDTIKFYKPEHESRYFKAIIPKGSMVTFNPTDHEKFAASSIILVHELTFYEAFKMMNKGAYNRGFSNVGNNNSGNYNSGNNNNGNSNNGNSNIGNNNDGNGNVGNGNSGNYNHGNNNDGHSNIGNNNDGNNNYGHSNIGNYNHGNNNNGNNNNGNYNSGNNNNGNGN